MMENQSNSNNQNKSNGSDLFISKQSEEYLKQTEKWAKFLAIVGFVFVGLLVIVALFASSIVPFMPFGPESNMRSGMGLAFSLGYLVMGAIYFFPTWYLYRFSKSMNDAVSNQNSDKFEKALANHKSFYKFIGIFTIILLAFYGIGLLVAIIGVV